MVINTPAELAYITANFDEKSDYDGNKEWRKLNFYLNADLDMATQYSWLPMGRETYNFTYFTSKFWGNGHTIRYKTWDLDEEQQGLFSGINSGAEVHDVNVVCNISTKRSYVGGIAGANNYRTNMDGDTYYGKITNCGVDANASSGYDGDARLGGICGSNTGKVQFCCMTGNVTNSGGGSGVGGIAGNNNNSREGIVEHVTFYGSVSVSHSQSSKYVGKSGTESDMYDAFDQSEYDAAVAAGMDLYARAIKYPYAVNITTKGEGTVTANVDKAYPGQTVRLTVTSERDVAAATVNVWREISGDKTNGYTFAMSRGNANVKFVFKNADGTIPDISDAYGLEDGKTYRVSENSTISQRIVARGTTTLIIDEGVTLNVPKGIELSADNEANHDNTVGGRITINGGVVTAKAGSSATSVEDGGAGIGGGGADNAKNPGMFGDNEREYGVCGDIIINGG